MNTSLVTTTQTRRDFSAIKSGDLVTVRVYNPTSREFDAECGAKVSRISHGNAWIRLAGLSAPYPYSIGDALVIGTDQITDW